MNERAAVAAIMRRFPDSQIGDVDRSSPRLTATEFAQRWPDRCHCGRHPHQGHLARPIHRHGGST